MARYGLGLVLRVQNHFERILGRRLWRLKFGLLTAAIT